MPALFLFSLNHDKDWYKKDLNDYERRLHWILGENIRVPKGMDFGIRFTSNLTEDFLNWATNNKKVNLTETFLNQLTDELPSLFTKNPVVSRCLQGLSEQLLEIKKLRQFPQIKLTGKKLKALTKNFLSE